MRSVWCSGPCGPGAITRSTSFWLDIPVRPRALVDRVRSNPQWGYNIRGILDDNRERGSQYDGVKIIGTIDDLEYILEQNSLDEIAITLSLGEYEKLRRSWPYVKRPGSTRNLSRITGISFPRSPIWKTSRVFRSSTSAMCP